jgi:precorrin-6A synthase
MRTVHVVGIGAGSPGHLTLDAVEVLGAVDVVLLLAKRGAADELTDARAALAARFAPQATVVRRQDAHRERGTTEEGHYLQTTQQWRDERLALYEELIAGEVPDGGSVALLAWGDPGIYDGTVDTVERIAQRGNVAISWTVIPGISAPAALTAAHRVTMTRTGRPVAVTPARQVIAGTPTERADLVVMLDGADAHGVDAAPDDATVYWGAYLGTPDEALVSGRVGDVREEILRRRAELRERKGWIMDTYLLRCPPGS